MPREVTAGPRGRNWANMSLKGFSAIHVASITATCWILLLNALVGYQLLDDGTAASIGLIAASAAVLFIGTGYISLDTAFNWTGHFQSSHTGNNRNIALYVLYQLFPLVCLVVFFLLEAVLVLRVLGEFKPMSKLNSRLFYGMLNGLELNVRILGNQELTNMVQFTFPRRVSCLQSARFSNM